MKNIQYNIIRFLLPLLLLTSCGSDETTEEMNQEELTVESICKYSIELDGQLIEKELNSTPTGMICNVSLSSAGDGIGYGTTLFSNNSDEELGFLRGTINVEFNEVPTPEQFDSLFYVGSYEFTEEGDEGILITYVSPNNETWSSDRGTGNQSGSNFQLLEKVSETISTGYSITSRVKFNCNLYNDEGEMKNCEGTATLQVLAFK